MANNLPFTNLDFADVKENLKNYLKGQDQFKDYDFEGSNINVLLDVLAYNTFQNNFYTNMAISEMFLDSAQIRDSVISHAKELNYLPRSRRSAIATITLSIFPTDTPSSIVIPAKTKFTARCGVSTYTFHTRESKTIFPSNGTYTTTLDVYEGRFITEFYTVSGTSDQKFIINNNNVDTNSIKVYVKDNLNSNIETEYLFKQNIYGVDSDDKIFYLQPYEGDKYEIVFGNNTFGADVTVGNVIRIDYMTTNGTEANGISAMTLADVIVTGYKSAVLVTRVSSSGAERESINSIKFFAPKSIQVQNRAITTSDYKVLLKNNFPEVKSVAVYGGENLFPPQFGRVVISVDTLDGNGITENTRETMTEFLSDKTAISIEPIIVNSKYMYLAVNSTIYYNQRITSKKQADITQAVVNAITRYSLNNLEDYDQNFKYSRFSSTIDAADISITSNDTTVIPFIEIFPTRNISNYFILQFQNRISPSITYIESSLTNYNPAVYSTTFTYKGVTSAFIQDNGSGRIDVVFTDSDGEIKILEKNLGTVDYTTGDVILTYITIQDYPASGIKIYAITADKKIIAPYDRIVKIRPQDITTNIIGVRE